jgi:hypothetical protein
MNGMRGIELGGEDFGIGGELFRPYRAGKLF